MVDINTFTLDLWTFVAKSAMSQLTRFWGALLTWSNVTFNGRWHKNFLKDWAHTFQDWANFHELYLNIRVYWNKIQASECLPSWSRPWPPPSPSSSPRGQPAQLWSNSGPPPHHIWKKSVKQNYRNTVQMSLIWEGQIFRTQKTGIWNIGTCYRLKIQKATFWQGWKRHPWCPRWPTGRPRWAPLPLGW